MNLALHLAAWDLRYLRHYLGLWLGLVILQAVLVGYAPQLSPVERAHVFSLSSFALLVAVLKICLLAVIVTQLVQKDSTIGSTAFWLSRPVSRVRLLTSKVFFLAVVIVVPSLLVEVGLLFVCGVIPHDILRSIPQILFLALLAVAVLMMLAAVTTSLARMILAGGLALFALPLLWFFIQGAWSLFRLGTGTLATDGAMVAAPIPPFSYGTFLVGIALVLLGTAGTVVGHQYLTRRTVWSRIFLVAGVLLALLSMGYWGRVLGTTSPGLDKAILDPEQVEARIEKESLVWGSARDALAFLGLGRGKKMFLQGRIALAPLPPDVVALPAQVSARLDLPSGETLANHVSRSHYAFSRSLDGRLELGVESLALLGRTLKGMTFLNASAPVGLPRRELFALRKDLFERHRGTGTVYMAQVDFLIQRNEIATMQLEEGARYDWGSAGAKILSVDTSYRGVLIVQLNEFIHRLMQDGHERSTYILINRSRQQALVGWGSGDSLSIPPTISSFFPMLKVRRLRLRFSPADEGPSLDSDWYDEAEMIRVETRDLGWFSKSIRLEDLVMERIVRSSTEATPTEAGGGTNGSLELE